MVLTILLITLAILEVMLLIGSNDSRKDEEQEQYIKEWKEKKNGRCKVDKDNN